MRRERRKVPVDEVTLGDVARAELLWRFRIKWRQRFQVASRFIKSELEDGINKAAARPIPPEPAMNILSISSCI